MDVVVVSFRSLARVQELLARHAAVLATTLQRVFLVNNDPGEPFRGEGTWPGGLRFIQSPENLGFAAAVNQGARLGTSPWILLMNPDVTVESAVLEAIPRVIQVPPEVAMIGGINEDPAGPRTHGVFPELVRDEPRVDWIAGSFALVRRAAFERLGGFDESYFMYFEDVDFGRRLARAGYTVTIDPRLVHRHAGHGSYRDDARRQARDFRASKARYLARHGTWLHHGLYTLYRMAPGKEDR